MKIRIAPLIWTVVLATLLGCATTSVTGEPRQSTDELAAAVVDGLVKAYEGRDVSQFMTLVSPQYVGGYEDFQDALGRALKAAPSARLAIRLERVREGQDDKVFVDALWSKTVAGGKTTRTEPTSGKVTLVFI